MKKIKSITHRITRPVCLSIMAMNVILAFYTINPLDESLYITISIASAIYLMHHESKSINATGFLGRQ
jgi:hypothetical protein